MELLLVDQQRLEDPGQGRAADLVLQRVVVPLPLHAAGEHVLHEVLCRVQVRTETRRRPPDLHGHHVAVAKPALTCTHTHAHARAHTRVHACAHTQNRDILEKLLSKCL